jgi:pimeloyl-ACP methyl ester carboxylesterase
MISGFGASSEFYNIAWIEEFSKFFKVFVFDNRGTGRSDKPDTEYSVKTMADDLVGLMEAITIPKAHVLGASMGGMIAQNLALNHPDKVATLTLLCTTCGGPNSIKSNEVKTWAQKIVDSDPSKMTEEENKEFMEWLWKSLYSQSFIEENREQLSKMTFQNMLGKFPTPRLTFKRHMQAVSTVDTYDSLSNIKSPTLVLAGEDDKIVSSENSKILSERIPSAQLQIFKGVGHLFRHEIGDQITEVVLNFLKKHPLIIEARAREESTLTNEAINSHFFCSEVGSQINTNEQKRNE